MLGIWVHGTQRGNRIVRIVSHRYDVSVEQSHTFTFVE